MLTNCQYCKNQSNKKLQNCSYIWRELNKTKNSPPPKKSHLLKLVNTLKWIKLAQILCQYICDGKKKPSQSKTELIFINKPSNNKIVATVVFQPSVTVGGASERSSAPGSRLIVVLFLVVILQQCIIAQWLFQVLMGWKDRDTLFRHDFEVNERHL